MLNPLIVTFPVTAVWPFRSSMPEVVLAKATAVPGAVAACEIVNCVALSTLTM